MRKFIGICIALLLMVSLAVSVSAAEGTPYVIDDAQLLTPEECQELNAYAEKITNQYGIGVYMMSVLDYRDYGEEYEIYDVLWNYYHDNKLGYGSGRQGMILMLSMEDRDYATFYYGVDTEYAFNDYGQEAMEEEFFDNFSENDWYGGFSDFMEVCDEYLTLAEEGDPVRFRPAAAIVAGFFMALPLAAIICLIIRKITMKSVKLAKEASRYVLGNGMHVTEHWDNFTHMTVTTRTLKKDSGGDSGGGSTVARTGGGGSGRSGKF